MQELKYLGAYSDQTRAQVTELIAQNRLAEVLRQRYGAVHGVRTDRALYEYVQQLKSEFLRNADPINKVAFDNKIHVIQHALGLHTSISRVQGNKLKAKHEIRVASMFKEVPLEFLRMIAVHELAHVKEKQHDKAFYKLCCYMELEFYYHSKSVDMKLSTTSNKPQRPTAKRLHSLAALAFITPLTARYARHAGIPGMRHTSGGLRRRHTSGGLRRRRGKLARPHL